MRFYFWIGLSLLFLLNKLVISQVNLTSTNLPIVCIFTYGQPILIDTSIVCDMGIIYNGEGEINQTSDPFNNYDGKISINIKGSTSLCYPKNSYRIETQDSEGQNLNVSLMDLPEENDWILYGPFGDKSLMRNVLIYELAREMGWYAPRTRFCELILDNEYWGVYVLIEKIKRDNNRVDISKLTPEDTTSSEITGGYLLQIDRWEGAGWHSTHNWNIYFEYTYPDDDEIVPEQEIYIQNFIHQFEDSLFNLTTFNNSTMVNTVDFDSFVDYIILNELSKNADAYRLSTYLYKDNDSVDGRLKMGPIWDYNLAFGNFCDFFAYQTDNFIYSDTVFWDYAPFWFRKLMSFEMFQNKVRCRWNELRTDILHENAIESIIDSCYSFLFDAQQRNFDKWDILGYPVWPNYYYGETYEEEIEILKDWTFERLIWLDDNIPGICQTTHFFGEYFQDKVNYNISPNPVSSVATIEYYLNKACRVQIFIFDIYGRLIAIDHFDNFAGINKQTINTETLTPGMYLFSLEIDGVSVGIKTVVKIKD